jgi:hypothetical protein
MERADDSPRVPGQGPGIRTSEDVSGGVTFPLLERFGSLVARARLVLRRRYLSDVDDELIPVRRECGDR